MLTLAVLGPVDLRRDGAAVPVPGRQDRRAARPPRPRGRHPGARRAAARATSGPTSAHGAAPNTLQSKVSRLRRALGDAVRRARRGCRVHPRSSTRCDVDAVHVLRLAEQVAAATSATHGAAGARRLVTLTGPAGVGKTGLRWRRPSDPARVAVRGWLGLETATDAAGVWHGIGEALGLDAPTRVPGHRSAARRRRRSSCSTAASTSSTPSPSRRARPARRRAGRPRAGHEPAARCGSAASRCSTSRRSPRRLGGAVQPSAPPRSAPTVDDDETRAHGRGRLPRARRPAAGHRAGRGPHARAAGARDRSPPRRPVRPAARPGEPPARPARPPCAPRSRWSYDLLFPDDQRGLWALAAFAGGAPLPAVESVLGPSSVPADSALDVVSRLVDRSLAIADIAPTTPARYRLLDSVRDLARERLDEAGLADVAAAAHARGTPQAADRAGAGAARPGAA